MDNNTTNIDDALSQDTFDVLAYVEATAYPTQEVTLYTNVKAAKRLVQLSEERRVLEFKDIEEAEKLTPEIESLEAAVEAGSLVFVLQGYSPGIVEEIMDNNKSEDDPEAADPHLISHAIQSVRKSNGAVDKRVWSADDVKRLRGAIVEGEYVKLLTAVAGVLFNAAVFSQATDAGFLGGRTDVASEL